MPAPYDGSFFGVLPLTDGAVLAYGLRGQLFRSENRGATWTAAALGFDVEFPLGDVLYAAAGVAGGQGNRTNANTLKTP